MFFRVGHDMRQKKIWHQHLCGLNFISRQTMESITRTIHFVRISNKFRANHICIFCLLLVVIPTILLQVKDICIPYVDIAPASSARLFPFHNVHSLHLTFLSCFCCCCFPSVFFACESQVARRKCNCGAYTTHSTHLPIYQSNERRAW